MANKDKKKNTVTLDADKIRGLGAIADHLSKENAEKEYEIVSAAIVDEICNFSYEIKKGVHEGFQHNVKGKGIVDDDLIDAIRNLNVHFACIDDVFLHSGINIESIERMENHELTAKYVVSGFKIKRHGDSEAIILIGSKSINCTGERLEFDTPKIPMDDLSSYQWHNELKAAADAVRMEVDLYMNGKFTPMEKKEVDDPAQLKITDITDDELTAAKVN